MDKNAERSATLELIVNGKRIATNPFVRRIMTGTILGMLGPLKGVEIDKPQEVLIKISAE